MANNYELEMMDADLPENDKEQVRFLLAWQEFTARFLEESRKGKPFIYCDIYDAFEAGVAHGRKYENHEAASSGEEKL